MNKIKPILQQGTSDCGCACIATILNYYGKEVSLRKITEEAGTDKIGTSGLGIIKAAQKFGLSCTGIMITEREKIDTLPFPAIFHIKTESQEHYIVPYKIKKDVIFYHDPAFGLTSEPIKHLIKNGLV